MNTRRKFLIQGSMATTAMLALKPFTTIARAASPFTDLSSNSGNLVFLHTVKFNPRVDYKVIQYINDIKNKNANTILLNAGQDEHDETVQPGYDVSAINGDYKIINKGKLRTGIISAKPGESNVIEKIKILSTYLKKEKNCTVVVCLSQLGYQNKNSPDDITLAKKTTHLDIIIGGHPDNFKMHPVIALNNIKGEVIIHSASGDSTGIGKIEFEFDGQGQKKNLSLNNHSSINTTPKRVKKVA
jgi:2',3'-cyclic-nucleotide 2'-phosphodiesterase (5'-nucleotidase family)